MKNKIIKIISIIISLICLSAIFAGCSSDEVEYIPDDRPATYSVTFRQTGFNDVVVYVKSGESVGADKIPPPQPKEGYTISWEDRNLTNIKSNILVKAIETKIICTVTFKQNGYEDIIVSVNYGEDLLANQIPTPQSKEGHNVSWESFNSTNIKSNILVKAIETKIIYTVTFRQNGCEDIIVSVNYGEALSSDKIPTPQQKLGYDEIVWENVDLTYIKSNLVVNAVETKTVYKIYFIYNAKNLIDEGVIDLSNMPTYIEVCYNDQVILPTYSSLTNAGFLIEGWYDDSGKLFTKVYYDILSDITLYAKWDWIG